MGQPKEVMKGNIGSRVSHM